MLNASIIPSAMSEDSLVWHLPALPAIRETSVSVTVRLDSNVSRRFTELVSRASIWAVNDSSADNNSATDTVWVTFPADKPSPDSSYNLVMRQFVETDTVVEFGGRSAQAAFEFDTLRYRLSVQNSGPNPAEAIQIWNMLPDSVTVLSSTPIQTREDANALVWEIDSLTSGDSINIEMNLLVNFGVPFIPFPLRNVSTVFGANDTLESDNSDSSLVYVISRSEDGMTDIAISQTASSDSFAVFGNERLQYVPQGGRFTYVLTVFNQSPVTARNVRLVNNLPDSVQTSGYQPEPQLATKDSLVWTLDTLAPYQSTNLSFDVRLAPHMPVGRNLLINTARASAENEDPASLLNNFSADTVLNIAATEDWQAMIEASPPIVEIGEPIAVKVQVTEPVENWDIWVHAADGSIDSNYADAFIASNLPQPGTWLDVEPLFDQTQFTTDAEEERLVFELRAVDIMGTRKISWANVMIRSQNAFNVDLNVFVPGRDGDIRIRFQLSSNRMARLDIYDITGSQIAKLTEAPYQAGWNSYRWDGRTENGQHIGSGFYIITIRSGEYTSWKKLMIAR